MISPCTPTVVDVSIRVGLLEKLRVESSSRSKANRRKLFTIESQLLRKICRCHDASETFEATFEYERQMEKLLDRIRHQRKQVLQQMKRSNRTHAMRLIYGRLLVETVAAEQTPQSLKENLVRLVAVLARMERRPEAFVDTDVDKLEAWLASFKSRQCNTPAAGLQTPVEKPADQEHASVVEMALRNQDLDRLDRQMMALTA
jgi:hypothetical protein